MSRNYKHINNNTLPSIDNIDVYSRSEYDYNNYKDAKQMTIHLCSVPWDMGIVHVGNAQIGGVGNVVYFDGGTEERDAWFDALEKQWTWSTNFRKFHGESEKLKIPLPYDEAIYYNYAFIDYEPIASAANLIYGESEKGGMRRWFFFIRNCESDSPNCTSLELVPDYWQQYSYNLEIPYMKLERGHYAMAQTPINDYLLNPIGNNDWLLCDDVNYGKELTRVPFEQTEIINKDVLLIFALSAQPNLSWGGAYGTLPADAHCAIDGVPSSVYLMAIEPSSFNGFMGHVEEYDPQFKTAVRGLFFAPRKLISLGIQRSWGDYTYWDVSPLTSGTWTYIVALTGNNLINVERTKKNFNYDKKYREIAKLYTDPYAHLEVSDGRGHTTIIKIEDTCGHIGARVGFNMSFPDLGITAQFIGLGNDKEIAQTFDNLSSRTTTTGGRWYDYLYNWDVPIYSVVQDNSRTDLCQNYYNYQAREYNAKVARDNAKRSASTAKTNADNSANAVLTNADINNAAASAVTARGNEATIAIDKTASTNLNNKITRENTLATILSAAADISAAQQGAQVAAATSLAQAGVNSVSSLANLDIGGAISAMPNAVISAGSNLIQTQIGVNLTNAQTNISLDCSNAITDLNNSFTATKIDNTTAAQTDNTNTHNSANTAIANNTANVTKTNASNTKNTTDTNADANYNATINEIEKTKKQAALQPPNEFGITKNTYYSHTMPIMLNTAWITQSNDAIARAGDEFLRFGYYAERNVTFDGNWNVMKKFSYWKCSDVWIKNLAQPDAPTDQLRYFLMGGVTIWRKPEYIGNTSIYENGV